MQQMARITFGLTCFGGVGKGESPAGAGWEFETEVMPSQTRSPGTGSQKRQLNPDPIMAILFRTEQRQLSRKDLEPMIGSRARLSEVLTVSDL